MLCYRGLNNDQLASLEEKLYLRFKANEAALAITGPYKLKHPEDNNEAQPIHEHLSGPLGLDASRQIYAQMGLAGPTGAPLATTRPKPKTQGGAAAR
jgi:hypothetical protein